MNTQGSQFDELFHDFIRRMNDAMDANHAKDDHSQSELFAAMLEAEAKFKEVLLSTEVGESVYDRFMVYLVEKQGGMLSAQPYFRERQGTFYQHTSKAFKANKSKPMHRLRINYKFVRWAMTEYKGPRRRQLGALCRKIASIRELLAVNNLPLVANRVKRFWFKVPENNLEYMDHIQAASEGLLTAVDKFVPGYGSFGSVAIGRMALNLLIQQNDTILKFSPKQRRVLYRTNMAKVRKNMEQDAQVKDFVNEKFPNVSTQEINLISTASANHVSLEAKDQNGVSLMDTTASSSNPEDESIQREMSASLSTAMSKLPILERKVLRLWSH